MYGVSYSGTFQGGGNPNHDIYGSDVYMVAGSPRPGTVIGIIQKYSLATNTITTYSFKDTRYGCASVVYGTSVYAIAGQRDGSGSWAVLNDVVVFNILTSTYSTVTVSSGSLSARLFHTATLYSTSIYVIGGVNGAYISSVAVFNIGTSAWTTPTTTGGFTARRDHSATLYTLKNNYLIYVIGGYNDAHLGDVWSFNIYSNVWTSVSFTGTFTARSGHSASLYNGIIYVVGGSCTSNNIQAFKVATKSWSTISTSAPTGRYHTGILYNNFIYTFGGTKGDDSHDFVYMYPLVGGTLIIIIIIIIIYCHHYNYLLLLDEYMLSSVPYTGAFDGGDLRYTTLYNDDIYAITYTAGSTSNVIQVFSVDTNKWSRVPYTGTIGARYGYACVIYTSPTGSIGMYIIGGWSSTAAAPLNDVVVYDFSTSSFSTVTTVGVSSGASLLARYYHTATLIDYYIFVIGGVGGGTGICFNDVPVYNMMLKAWSVLPTTGTFSPRSHHTATFYNNVIYVIGGYVYGSALSDVMSLNIVSRAWSTISTTGTFTARYGHSAVLYGTSIYVIGGKGSSITPVIDAINVFSILTSRWSSVPYTNPLPLRYLHSSLLYGGVIYILGGKATSSDASLNDVASFEVPGNTIVLLLPLLILLTLLLSSSSSSSS